MGDFFQIFVAFSEYLSFIIFETNIMSGWLRNKVNKKIEDISIFKLYYCVSFEVKIYVHNYGKLMNFNADDQNSFAQNSYVSSIIFRVLLAWQSNNNDSYKKLQKNDLQILVKLSQLLAEIIICFCSAKTGEQRMAFDLKRCQKHTK